VVGSVEPAAAGKLKLLVGGDAEALARVLPVLDELGERVLRVGESGAGMAAKLLNNAARRQRRRARGDPRRRAAPGPPPGAGAGGAPRDGREPPRRLARRGRAGGRRRGEVPAGFLLKDVGLLAAEADGPTPSSRRRAPSSSE